MKTQLVKSITISGLIGILMSCGKDEIPVNGINLSETNVALSVDSVKTLNAEIGALMAEN